MSFANGLNLNGIGARAVSMGGAFVGLADDYSAVFWNPAGIAQFDKKYFAFYGTDIIPSMTYKWDLGMIDAKSVTEHNLAGLVAYYHPVSENLVTGIAVYPPSGLGIEWHGSDLAAVSGLSTDIEWRSKIFVLTIAPTLAYKVNDMVSIGATFNINYGSFDLALYAGTTDVSVPIPFPPYVTEVTFDLAQQKIELTGWGYGATFGVLIKPSEMFSMGATFRTPSTIKFSGDAGISGFSQLGLNPTSEAEADLTLPMWIAGGIAFKPIENLTLTADIHWTQWSKIDEIEIAFTDPIWANLLAEEDDDKMAFHWKDAAQIRFGAEYWMSPKFALRAGYYHDPGPAPDKTRNILLPITDFNSFSVGFGYNINGVYIDLGIEYLIGKENNVPIEKVLFDPDWESAMPGVYDLKILALEFAIGYQW
jgi:long-chain fatty acid transport protein